MNLELPKRPIKWLIENITNINIAQDLDDDILGKIGREVVSGYLLDDDSRSEWKERNEDGLKIAMQVKEHKTHPWPNCANIMFPLISTAAIQFASRAYSEIVRGRDIVHAAVNGDDPTGEREDRAKRIGEHMSYQLLDEMPEWECDTDQLLHILPLVGCHFRKTYYSDLYKRNISEGVLANHFVVNYNAKDLATCRRATHEIYLYKNEALEKERFGLWLESEGGDYSKEDAEDQELFLEQYCWLDLDGDGYEEPYVVMVHKETEKVKRITARYEMSGITESPVKKGVVAKIDPVEYFTKFSFIPSPDGGFYDLGFNILLGPLNDSINTLLNLLVDAGTLSNLQSGFISQGIRVRGGNYSFRPGEWKIAMNTGQVLKDSLVPLPAREPSGVLFQLLGFLNDNAMRLASVSETMSGETPGANVPATTVLALIEQGLKVFTSIYKRIFRSLKSEYAKLYRLNSIYLPDQAHYRILTTSKAIARQDYILNDCAVEPVADPTQASEALRLAKARALMEIMQSMPLPEQKVEILRRYCEALSVTNLDKLFPMDKIQAAMNAPPPPNPELLRLQLDTHKAEDSMRHKDIELHTKIEEAIARIELMAAQAQKAVADAAAVDLNHTFEQRSLELDKMLHDFTVNTENALNQFKEQGKLESSPQEQQKPPDPQMMEGNAPPEGDAEMDMAPVTPSDVSPEMLQTGPEQMAPGMALPDSALASESAKPRLGRPVELPPNV